MNKDALSSGERDTRECQVCARAEPSMELLRVWLSGLPGSRQAKKYHFS